MNANSDKNMMSIPTTTETSTTTTMATPPTRRSFLLQTVMATIASAAAAMTTNQASAAVAERASTATILPTNNIKLGGKPVYGDESIMSQKSHGTSEKPVQKNLLYGVSDSLADKICNYNRHFAEFAGYFRSTSFEDAVVQASGPVTFYDSVTGKPLFVAPIGRSARDFVEESSVHGWPSFRDSEVVWDNVRILKKSGETVSIDGTHLGHNLPDRKGNRYCINLVSIAGRPIATTMTTTTAAVDTTVPSA